MARIERLTQTKDLKTTKLNKMAQGHERVMFFRYDDLSDTLFFLFVSPETPTIVHHIDKNVALLYEPTNKEVVGLQVEYLQAEFLEQNKNVKKEWHLKGNCEDKDLDNLGEISLIFEKRTPIVAQSVAKYAKDKIHPPKNRSHAVTA